MLYYFLARHSNFLEFLLVAWQLLRDRDSYILHNIFPKMSTYSFKMLCALFWPDRALLEIWKKTQTITAFFRIGWAKRKLILDGGVTFTVQIRNIFILLLSAIVSLTIPTYCMWSCNNTLVTCSMFASFHSVSFRLCLCMRKNGRKWLLLIYFTFLKV